MADANSTINVKITGDAKGLQSELGKADKGVQGLSASAGKLVGALALGAAAAGVADFAKTALGEADRLGDATTRLELQVGGLSDQLVQTADDFTHLGQSTQDILELEAAFADTATAVGLADEDIVKFADDAAATAAAIALLGDMDADQAIDLIGKAADGGAKALKALGLDITDAEIEARALADTGKATADALTDSELAAAAYALVLEDLSPKLDAVNTGMGDTEQKAAELQAKWETLTGKIGEGIEGPLNALLGWMIEGIEGWDLLGQRIAENEQALKDFLGPAAAAADLLSKIAILLGSPGLAGQDFLQGDGIFAPSGGSSFGGTVKGASSGVVTLNVVPKDSADTERAVIEALRDWEARNGERFL